MTELSPTARHGRVGGAEPPGQPGVAGAAAERRLGGAFECTVSTRVE